MESDWTEMLHAKFLSEAQKFEAIDLKDRQKLEKKREASKRKTREDDSISTLSRSQRSRNAKGTKRKMQTEPTSQGKARLCELCKLAGAPDYVYLSHNTNQCNKKDSYAAMMSGGTASRSKATKDFHSKETYRKREAKLISKIKQLKKKAKKARKEKDDDDVSSISSVDTNVSF